MNRLLINEAGNEINDDTADKNKMGHLNLKIFLSLNYFITCFIVFK